MGMTFASLRELGKAPLLKDKLINWDSGIDNCCLKFFKILVVIVFGTAALWSSSSFIRSTTSSISVGQMKQISHQHNLRNHLNLLALFGRFWRSLSATEVQKFLKLLASVLSLSVTVLLTLKHSPCSRPILTYLIEDSKLRLWISWSIHQH